MPSPDKVPYTAPDESSSALAILIDADNASPSIVKGLIDEIAKLGRATVRRIYGDWTTPNLGTWKEALLEHSIQPVQQFARGLRLAPPPVREALAVDEEIADVRGVLPTPAGQQ